MPSAAKTRWSQLKVGILAAIAIVILVFLVLTMASTNPLFRKTQIVYTYFDDSFAMTAGATPVRLNGILIGKVANVELSGEEAVNRTVKVSLALNDDALEKIPVDSTAGLAQQNLLGARYINVKRGRSATPLQAGGEIRSQDTVEIQDMLEQGTTTLAALQTILKRVENIVIEIEDGKGTIGKFLHDETLFNTLVATVNEAKELVEAVNNPKSSFGRLIHDDDLYTDVRTTMSKVNQLLDGLNSGEGTAGKFLKDDALYADLRSTIADFRETLRLVNSGNGTIGKMMTTDTLHVRLEGTMSRLDAMLDKVNSGEGTLGQLLLNPALYESMDGTMREVQSMMKDFRANPKKFLTIQLKLF
jgi:phospholipid/cholesterol/gamma-HCH transport system substrate-binding protein